MLTSYVFHPLPLSRLPPPTIRSPRTLRVRHISQDLPLFTYQLFSIHLCLSLPHSSPSLGLPPPPLRTPPPQPSTGDVCAGRQMRFSPRDYSIQCLATPNSHSLRVSARWRSTVWRCLRGGGSSTLSEATVVPQLPRDSAARLLHRHHLPRASHVQPLMQIPARVSASLESHVPPRGGGVLDFEDL